MFTDDFRQRLDKISGRAETMNNSNEDIRAMLETVFDDLREGVRATVSAEEYARRKRDFSFHMLDWTDDLDRLSELIANPEKHSRASAAEFIVGFLYHVVPHLNAAFELLLDEPPRRLPQPPE